MVRRAIFDKKNILVIGGAGFIGSHLCTELVKQNKVICVDNYVSGNEENINPLLINPNFEFVRADITQPLDLEGLAELEKFEVKFQGVQEVYNLACPTSRKEFAEHVVDTCLANSVGVYNSLEIAKKYQAKYLFASSSSVYGDPLEGQKVFTEDYWGFLDYLNPRGCYNEGKRFGEVLTRDYGQINHLDVKIARIFNTYGPAMQLDNGKLIPDFIRAALNKQKLIIFGTGQDTSSYCYVSDLVEGLLRLMKSSIADPVNLGNPETLSVTELAKKIIALTNSASEIEFAPPLEHLTKQGLPDITRAKERLGWFPIVRLADGLSKTIAAMQASRHLHYVDNKLTASDY